MKSRRWWMMCTLTIVVGLVPVIGQAGFSATECFLPSVGRGPGSSDSEWFTTVWIYNPGTSPANIQISYLIRDRPNPAPAVFYATVPPGQVHMFENVIYNLFGVEGFGALRIVANQSVIVNSRIFSVPDVWESDSVGQFFPAVPASFAIGVGESTQLLGVTQATPVEDSVYRYNYGFVETTGGNVTVTVTARDQNALVLATDTVYLGPFEPRQWNLATRLLPSTDVRNVRLEVEVTGGNGKIIAFGSGLANNSNDPSTFEMSYRDELLVENSGGDGTITGVTAGSGLTGGGTSGAVSLSVGQGEGIDVTADSVALADQAVDASKLATNNAPTDGNALVYTPGGLQWQEVSGSGGGDITGVVAGNGLGGGGQTGEVELAVAEAGITTGMIADAAVNGAKISNGAVSKSKLSAPGGSPGQVLSTDGSSLAWQAPTGLVLPYAGTGSSSDPSFSVNNDGGGVAISGSHDGFYGLLGYSLGGVYGYARIGTGVTGESRSWFGVQGISENMVGIFGEGGAEGVGGISQSGKGVNGYQRDSECWGALGMTAPTGGGTGVYGSMFDGLTDWAGYFEGDVRVTGNIVNSSRGTIIDHPLDPENRLLRHSSVESPESLLIYRGTVQLGSRGEGEVEMPEYFAALSREDQATVSLTPVGRPFLTGYDWRPGHSTFVAFGEPGREVAWVVFAERDDPVIRQHRRPIEEDKRPDSKVCPPGKLLQPTAYGYPESMGVGFEDSD